jgi:hypothetical protein
LPGVSYLRGGGKFMTFDQPEQHSERATERQLEEAIRSIRGVQSTRVIIGPSGQVDEVHVLAGAGRNPKQIVRDIESVFQAGFGLSLDHKKISVAQTELETQAVVPVERARLARVACSSAGARTEVTVELEVDGQLYAGQAAGPTSPNGRLRQVAAATLEAVESCFSNSLTIALEEVATVTVGRRNIVVVILSLIRAGQENVLVGSSQAWDDDREAAARAVLDALNRRLPMLWKAHRRTESTLGPATR